MSARVVCMRVSLYSVYLVYVFFMIFIASRRRHTRCALVTGVQTCALPIYSYFPHWKLADDTVPGAIIAPDERLSWPKNVAMGAQHVVAMFGSTVQIGRASRRERVCQYV